MSVVPCPPASLHAEPALCFRGGVGRTKAKDTRAQGPGGQEGDAGVCDHDNTRANVRGTGWWEESGYGAQGQPGAGLGCHRNRDSSGQGIDQ